MARLVSTAQRQLAADLASSSHRRRGSHATVSSSSRRLATRATAATRTGEVPPTGAQQDAPRDPPYAVPDARIRIEQLCDAPPASADAAPTESREKRRERRWKWKLSHDEEEGHVLAADETEKPS
uniref:Uncharacterized protein n=1 Tax=Leersia perrieri TaxID=77586 RepID=A0A0D9XI18_9ORYZ